MSALITYRRGLIRANFYCWWPKAELNRRHKDFQSSALPTELFGLVLEFTYCRDPDYRRQEKKLRTDSVDKSVDSTWITLYSSGF